jgi:SAM-dependent MidA family methyltransferase
MTAGKTELEKKLIERIKREGRISFRDFMQAALYDAEFGYYNTERLKIGAMGDYYTSSNVHPAFGAILAKAFVELWHQLDETNQFTIVEMGSGTGQLAFDILQALRLEHHELFDLVTYTIIEQSVVMRARQREKLKEFESQVDWRSLQELEREPLTGIVFSNELLDAFPVHRIRFSPKGIEELFVGVENPSDKNRASLEGREKQNETLAAADDLPHEKLALVWESLSNGKLEQYIKRTGVRFFENQVIEINLEAIGWLETLAAAIAKGFLITIDYGDVAAHLYSPERRQGTLRCFYRHTLTHSSLERIGEQDLTASINFSALLDYGKEVGFAKVSYERQTHFLFRHGLIERIAAMEQAATIENLKDRLAIKNLLAPGGVSDNFRVLIQKKSGDEE